VAEAASKQSGRSIVPKVDAPLTVSEAAKTFSEYDMTVFPYENESGITIKNILRDFSPQGDGRGAESGLSRIAIIIGPEGGFTEAEASAIAGAGAKPCSLGRTILRTETAGPAAVAMVLYELEL
jgi:16S rRNA (uracil1498-N3)-methyltransferase